MTYEIKYRNEEEMKDSGIEWIGSIPKEWRLTKLKFVIDEFIAGGTPNSSNENYYTEFEKGIPWISISDMSNTGIINKTKASLTRVGLRSKNLKTLKKGTLIYSIFATLGKVSEINIDATTNQAILGLNNNKLLTNKEYLKYWLINLERNLKYYSSSNTQENLNTNKVRNFKFLNLKNIKNQQKIANFLDLKTAEFDSIISKKELLIEKLDQAKKSLISEVVTGKVKILDGELVERKADEMKDSGVEWLGMIPKDWEVKRLKQVVLEPLKYGANESGDDDNRMNPRYIRITDFGDDGKLKNDTFRSLENKKAKEFMLAEGDILFARSGATVGKTFQFKDYEIEACFAGYLIKATPNIEIISSDYLSFFTKTLNYENWKNSIFIQATIQNIGADKYRELKLCLPDVFEQDAICKSLNLKTGRINSIITKTKQQIQKLKEAKQSLISEAVTGKIDLRDWVIEEI